LSIAASTVAEIIRCAQPGQGGQGGQGPEGGKGNDWGWPDGLPSREPRDR
jgi:hypothetical protein